MTILFMIYETEHAIKRELLSTSLIAYHLERLGYTVRWAKIEDLFMIDLIHPDVVLLSDTYNLDNLFAARYAKERGYPLITFEAEVTYYPNYFPDLVVWGWNKEKVLYEDLCLIASPYVTDILAKEGKDASRYIGTGVHRFDIYPISTFMTKKTFLEKYKWPAGKSVVSYATWGFEPFFDKENALLYHYTDYNDPLCESLRQFKAKIHDWLEGLITSMPDVIFVLKLHPATDLDTSEVAGLNTYPNTVVIRSEVLAPDLISASDAWITFNSTTILEAYYFKKPVLICTLDPELDKILVPYVKGADCVRTVDEARNLLKSYLDGSRSVSQHATARKQINDEFVHGFDGLNSYRCAKAIQRFMQASPSRGQVRFTKVFYRSLIRSAVRRVATVLVDAGVRLPLLKRYAGGNRFVHKTIRQVRADIDQKLDRFLKSLPADPALYN